MNGFDAELRERILRAVPHGYISQTGGLSDWQNGPSSCAPILM